jgi:DNA-directed RNA polymerase specialized sigma24 family protein
MRERSVRQDRRAVVPGGTSNEQAEGSGEGVGVEELLLGHLRLIYNITGWALDGHADIDDVVRDIMARTIDAVGPFPAADVFRARLVTITMSRIREWWLPRETPGGAVDDPAGPGQEAGRPADFVDLLVGGLGLSGQRLQIAEATRWLDPEDREVLALWWVAVAGELTAAELAVGLGVSEQEAEVRIQRMRQRLDAGRALVRALTATPRCGTLLGLTARWDGRPGAEWRRRFTRHVAECVACCRSWSGLVAPERLLAGLVVAPVPVGHSLVAAGGPASHHAARVPQPDRARGDQGSDGPGPTPRTRRAALVVVPITVAAAVIVLIVAVAVRGSAPHVPEVESVAVAPSTAAPVASGPTPQSTGPGIAVPEESRARGDRGDDALRPLPTGTAGTADPVRGGARTPRPTASGAATAPTRNGAVRNGENRTTATDKDGARVSRPSATTATNAPDNKAATTRPTATSVARDSSAAGDQSGQRNVATCGQTWGGGGGARGCASFQSVNYPDRYIRDRGGLVHLDPVSAAAGQDATFIVVPGLADAGCSSFVGSGGRYLRHSSFRLRVEGDDGSALFRRDATFCPRPGPAGGVALEAYNYPGRFVRHRNFELWLDTYQDTTVFRADSSFRIAAPLG